MERAAWCHRVVPWRTLPFLGARTIHYRHWRHQVAVRQPLQPYTLSAPSTGNPLYFQKYAQGVFYVRMAQALHRR
jgi:hypothetical protein